MDSSTSGRMAVLASRGVLQAEGQPALGFLQGIVTNDVRPLENAGPQQAPVYANILTPKGKFLHDVFVYPHPELRDTVLIEVDAGGAAAALSLLNRYKLRRPITFRDVSAQYRVMAAWGGTAPPAGPWWRPDPRMPELGFRALVPVGEQAVGATASTIEDDYRQLRYSLGVAEGEVEIPAGQAAPLDYNMDVLRGVSYTKGCYVGQERNSFTHYRGVIRKRLMPVRLEALEAGGLTRSGAMAAGPGPSSAAAASMVAAAAGAFILPGVGTDVIDSATGRSVGQLRGAAAAAGTATSSSAAAAGGGTGGGGITGPSGGGGGGDGGGALWGIAYLKLESALASAEGRGELLLSSSAAAEKQQGAGGGEVGEGGGYPGPGAPAAAGSWRVVPVRPVWWLAEWGYEEGASGAGKSS